MAAGSDVYVLGGYHDRLRPQLDEGEQALLRADAGVGARAHSQACEIAPEEIESAHVGNFAAELYCMQGHLGAFFTEVDPAFSGLPTSRHEAACASGSDRDPGRVRRDRGGPLRPAGRGRHRADEDGAPPPRAAPTWGPPPGTSRRPRASSSRSRSSSASLGDEYDKRYGLKDEHLAEISRLNYDEREAQPERADAHLVHEQGARALPHRRQRRGGRAHPHRGLLAGDRRRGLRLPRLAPSTPASTPRARGIKLVGHPEDQGLGPQHGPPALRGQGGRESRGRSLRAAARAQRPSRAR